MTVRGDGHVEGPPELATVSAVLHVSGRTAADVTRGLAEAAAHQVDVALPDLPFETVRTEPFAVSPVFDRRSGVRITGCTGRCTTRLTLADFFGLADLVVALAGLPDVRVDGHSWSLRRGSPLEQEARHAAVRSAVARARDDAAALDATLGDLLELADTDTAPSLGARMFAMPAPGAPAPELDLEPQPQTVTASVTARFTFADVPRDLGL